VPSAQSSALLQKLGLLQAAVKGLQQTLPLPVQLSLVVPYVHAPGKPQKLGLLQAGVVLQHTLLEAPHLCVLSTVPPAFEQSPEVRHEYGQFGVVLQHTLLEEPQI
jgi:hypothetical protein